MVATKVSQPRQGPLLALAIGAAGRIVADQISDETNSCPMVPKPTWEMVLDRLTVLGPSCSSMPCNAGSKTTQRPSYSGLVWSSLPFVCSGRSLRKIEIIMRFDEILDKADKLAELDISVPFRAWMLMALIRSPPKKLTEYLK